MTEDEELIERLRHSLASHADSVSAPDDPWEPFAPLQSGTARSSTGPVPFNVAPASFSTGPLNTLPLVLRPQRARWVPASAVAVALAVAAALFLVLRSPATGPSVKLVSPASTGNSPSGPVSVAPTTPPITAVTSPVTSVPTSGPAGGPVPKGFTPASVTFVSARTGWVLGTAPCASAPCTSVVRTSDGGQTWVGIPAPRTPLSPADSNGGVTYLRFANLANGWAFGPQLWVTHDGGAHWNQITLPGAAPGGDVMDVETAGGVVYAAVAGTNGMIQIESSPVGVNQWTVSPTEVPIGAGPVPSVQIVLQGGSGWLIENDRTVVGGARLVGGAWVAWQPPCAGAEGPAMLAASSATRLVAVCDYGLWGSSTTPFEQLYGSTDGGTTFQLISNTVGSGAYGISLIATPPAPGTIVLANPTSTSGATQELVASFDGGSTFAAVTQPARSFPSSTGRWQELGFTTTTQGVAIGLGPGGASGFMLMTYDGGHTWTTVAFRQAS